MRGGSIVDYTSTRLSHVLPPVVIRRPPRLPTKTTSARTPTSGTPRDLAAHRPGLGGNRWISRSPRCRFDRRSSATFAIEFQLMQERGRSRSRAGGRLVVVQGTSRLRAAVDARILLVG
jgi:hypothetical protein